MCSQGFAPVAGHGKKPNVAAGRKAMVSKMEVLLAAANRPWLYLDGIIKQMLGEVMTLAWLKDEQVRKVLQMLIIDAKRHGRL